MPSLALLIININWQACINPYVLLRAPKAIGPALVDTYTVAIISVTFEVKPDILPITP